MALTPQQLEIKDEFIKVRGSWGPHWETILQLDPEFMPRLSQFLRRPVEEEPLG